MNTTTSHDRMQDRLLRARLLQDARRGSTLMIVIVLMGLLALLGVLFYTIAAQERSNAEYYADGAKNDDDPGGRSFHRGCCAQEGRGLVGLLGALDAEELGATNRALTLHRLATILHGHFLGISHLPLLAAFHTIGFNCGHTM